MASSTSNPSPSKSSDGDEDSDGFIGWDHGRRDRDGSISGEGDLDWNDVHGSKRDKRRDRDDRTGSTQSVEGGGRAHVNHSNNSNSNHNNAQNNNVQGNEFDIDYDSVDSVSDDSSTSTSTNNRWSLNVRLNSTVDLPFSIIPSIPLCPLMKFGLITVTDELEITDLEKSSAKFRRAEFERKEVQVSSTTDSATEGENPYTRQASLQILTPSGKRGTLAHFQNSSPLEECVTSTSSLKAPKIQLTSGKIMSKKDNGMMEWHEDMRWDDVEMPLQTVLCVELSARAVFPSSFMSAIDNFSNDVDYLSMNNNNEFTPNTKSSSAPSSGNGGILNFWRKNRQRGRRGNPSGTSSIGSSYHGSEDGVDMNDENQKEMEKAAAAATVARYLMDYKSKSERKLEVDNNPNDDDEEDNGDSNDNDTEQSDEYQDGDIRLGTLLIPISNLPLEEEVPTVEKWFQFDSVTTGNKGNYDAELSPSSRVPSLRPPSVLLQISLSNPDTLDEIEEEAYLNLGGEGENIDDASTIGDEMRLSLDLGRDRLGSADHSIRTRKGVEEIDLLRLEEEEQKIAENGPYLEPGIVDHICVVGPGDIGNLKYNSGAKGWIENDPECCVLEQFPPEGFHVSNGRESSVPHKVEWWCFPEGCRLWRGSEPPTHMDMNLKRFSASSPPTMASSIAAFDACLDCTSSFMWWVMSSNSDEYGSKARKIYGAVIRFYVPAPCGIDTSQEEKESMTDDKRLWAPIGICVTSSLPVVGTLEALLLRLCEKMSTSISSYNFSDKIIHRDIKNLLLNYQSPVPGVINCSIPFLSGDGDRLLISLPPTCGLPALPHGASVTSVCRLLGAEGLTALLAAVLTECKILIHSADVANLAMVAEVVTALIYPFRYQLPFIPVIPLSLMEVIEAPVSYLIGVPSCNMKWVEKDILTDIVVIDLDNGFSTPDYFDGRRSAPSSRATTPLPASVSSNISKAIFRLLRDEDEVQEQFGASNFSETRHLPRLDNESLAERNFRIAVAQQICSLIRGYQECLFFVSANQPVFNRDRFLRQAPALFEERRGAKSNPPLSPSSQTPMQRILSPRSKRFLSGLVNTQHFHDLLERLDAEETSFFHQVMDSFQSENQGHVYGSQEQKKAALELSKGLEEIERVIPTYHVHRDGNRRRTTNLTSFDEDEDMYHVDNDSYMSSFTSFILKKVDSSSKLRNNGKVTADHVSKKVSLKQMMVLEKKQWDYCKLFDINLTGTANGENDADETKFAQSALWSKIQLKEAMGERKFRAWKLQQEKKDFSTEEVVKGNQKVVDSRSKKSELDLTKLIPAASEGASNFLSRNKRNGDNTGDERDVVRRYIETAYEVVHINDDRKREKSIVAFYEFISSGKSKEVEVALRKPSAQRFLVSVLSQRSRIQDERRQSNHDLNGDASVSRLKPIVFECLVRLSNAMLEACMKDYDYESAYRLLTHTTGFCTVATLNADEISRNETAEVSYMTKRVGMHGIYSDLRLWERVLLLHQQDRQKDRPTGNERFTHPESMENDEYEATVSTLYEMLGYGMPADDLAKFASRIATEKFFSTDKEQKILVLARRLALKCDDADADRDSMLLEVNSHDDQTDNTNNLSRIVSSESGAKAHWEEICWSHPISRTSSGESRNNNVEGYTGQSPITALTSFGSSVVASGALDGSIFLAHTFNLEKNDDWTSSPTKNLGGVRLEWQKQTNTSSSATSDDNGGAISCLAASKGTNHTSRPNAFAHSNDTDNDAIMAAVAGCRIVGGTTGGDIRVWSVQEVLTNELAQDMEDVSSMMTESYASSQSPHVRSRSSHDPKIAMETKRGRSLGGHRGGVTCLSIPAQIYRPDSLISGGNDGLIKQWSLRHEPPGESRRMSMGGRTSRMLFSGRENSSKSLGKEAVNVLAGHGGRILCLETAWHGDRLLSGAADRTMKLWDLSSSGGQCIQTMHGHTGWVTNTCFWGRNTAISASTDRSIALWDARAGSVPLFVLRHHQSPVSDLYIESRNAFWMTSAGADGTIATWDFRKLSNLGKGKETQASNGNAQTVRQPMAKMKHCRSLRSGTECSGPVMLAKGVGLKYGQGDRSVMSVSMDGFINGWDVLGGRLLSEHNTRHGNKISCFKTYNENSNLLKGRKGKQSSSMCTLGGTITAAWDGKIRVRRMVLKKDNDK